MRKFWKPFLRLKKAASTGVMAIAAAGLLAGSFGGITAFADESAEWTVKFDGEAITSTFDQATINDIVSNMQPGDNTTFTVTIDTQSDDPVDWWMSNDIIRSFEDSSEASDGAYTYILTYHGPGGDNTLYSSETVGGDENSGTDEGLHEATEALKEFFYLDTIQKGQAANVELYIELDGETQGNSYQNTIADLQMRFGVEVQTEVTPDTPAQPKQRVVPKTGDTSETGRFAALAGISGAGLLIVGFFLLRRDLKKS